MTNRDHPVDDGSISSLPWAAVFDPSVNIRALGEVQARGFRAATDLVERFTRSTSAPTDRSTIAHAAKDSDRDTQAVPDVDQVLRACEKLVVQATQSMRNVVGLSASDVQGSSLDLAHQQAVGGVAMQVSQTVPVVDDG